MSTPGNTAKLGTAYSNIQTAQSCPFLPGWIVPTSYYRFRYFCLNIIYLSQHRSQICESVHCLHLHATTIQPLPTNPSLLVSPSILCFSILTCRPIISAFSLKILSVSLNSGRDSHIMSTSPANTNLSNLHSPRHRTPTPGVFLITYSSTRLNRLGAIGHPWCSLTQQRLSSSHSLAICSNSIILHRESLWTLSYAWRKSANKFHASILCCLTINNWCTVNRPGLILPGILLLICCKTFPVFLLQLWRTPRILHTADILLYTSHSSNSLLFYGK